MSSSTQDVIPQLDLGNTFGAFFIAVIVAAVLFGLSNVQAFIYFQMNKSKGITFYKLLVIWLWTLDALHLALIVHFVYYYLVINYADIGALSEVVWSFKLQIIVDAFIVCTVHLLYVYRIWIVSTGRSKALPIAVFIIEILGAVVAIALIWDIYQCRVFTDLIKTEWSSYMTVVTTTVIDIVIASSLCYLLTTSRTGFSSTDSLITKLMGYIINTGCLTSMCSMAAMITCATMPRNFIFLSIFFIVVKLYVNSFLALMNAPYYMQSNAGTIDSSGSRMVYRPELHVRRSQDDEPQSSRKDIFPDPDDKVAHPTRSVMPQRPIEVAVEMNSFSAV